MELLHRALVRADLALENEKITGLKTEYGGSINDAFSFQLGERRFFAKHNSRNDVKQFFSLEAKGLSLLENSRSINVPLVQCVYHEGRNGVLIMDYIESGSSHEDWELFGRNLAALHANSNNAFGLDHHNYIGSLEQKNTPSSDWTEFFAQERLEVQYQYARNSGLLGKEWRSWLDQLYSKLNSLMPLENPALLHGDLWSGNYKFNKEGVPYVFDPSVYYGHREVDIAMMHLFGGFDKRLFSAYQEVKPLENGWEERIDLFNLYPLFVHVNLFGGSYVTRLKNVLNNYI